MALIVLAAAKGAPGVTTATAALAAVWPEPAILVEADPSGSDLQLLARTTGGRHLQGGQRGAGVLGLATHGGSRSTLLKEPICQDSDLGVPVIIGPPHPRSAHAMGPSWQQVASALAQLSREGDYDVLVDAGRLDDQSMSLPLINLADVVVLIARRNLRGIAHTRRVATIVEENMRQPSVTVLPAVPRLLLVDDPATPKRVETQWPVAARGLTLNWSMLPMLTWDGEGAQSLFDARAAHRDTSTFLASIRTVATELHDLASRVSTLGIENGIPGGATDGAAVGGHLSGNPLTDFQVLGSNQGTAQTSVVSPSSSPSLDAASTTVVEPANSEAATSAPMGLTPLSSSAPANLIPAGVVWPPVPPSRRRIRTGQSSDFGTALDATLEESGHRSTSDVHDDLDGNLDGAAAETSAEAAANRASATAQGTSHTSSSSAPSSRVSPEPEQRPGAAYPDQQLTSTGAGPR